MGPAVFLIGMAIYAGIPFSICLGLGWSGRRRAAWCVAGVIAGLAVAAMAVLSLGEYEAGLAGFAILLFGLVVLLPIMVGALLGAALGQVLGRNR